MKSTVYRVLGFFLFTVLIIGPLSGNERAPGNGILSDLRLTPLVFRPPEPATEALVNGAVLLSQPDDSLPFVTIELVFPGGTNSEKLEETGNLSAMTRLLSIGGAGEKSGDKIADLFASMGAKFTVHEEYETWSVSLTVLKRDFDPAFALLSEILLHPRLPADRLEVIKSGMISQIAQRNDDPADTGFRKLMEAMYRGKRRGHSLEESDVKKISAESVRNTWKSRLTSKNLYAALGGDFRDLNMKQKLTELLSSFGTESGPQAENISRDQMTQAEWKGNPYHSKIILIEAQAVQTAIYISSFIPGHNSPDFYSMQVGNYILGGGDFNSRLMSEIRAKRGLAYYAYSRNSFLSSGGEFVASSATRSEAAGETIQAMLSIMASMKNGSSDQELSLSRESILNRLIFQFDDPMETLRSEIRFRMHGMPSNYLATITEKIRAVTDADIRRTAGYYSRDSLFIVVVGPASLKKELEKIMPVVMGESEKPL